MRCWRYTRLGSHPGPQHDSHWIIANIKPRLDIGNDPWKAYSSSAQKLEVAMEILGKRRLNPKLWFDIFPVRPECRA